MEIAYTYLPHFAPKPCRKASSSISPWKLSCYHGSTIEDLSKFGEPLDISMKFDVKVYCVKFVSQP